MKPLDFPLLADENINPEVVEGLTLSGKDILSVATEGLAGHSDREILRCAEPDRHGHFTKVCLEVHDDRLPVSGPVAFHEEDEMTLEVYPFQISLGADEDQAVLTEGHIEVARSEGHPVPSGQLRQAGDEEITPALLFHDEAHLG